MPASELMTRLTRRKVTLSDSIQGICLRKFRRAGPTIPVSELARVLGRYPYAVVESKNGKPRTVCSNDLVQYMAAAMQDEKKSEPQAQAEAKEAKEASATPNEEAPAANGASAGPLKLASLGLFAAAASGAAWWFMKKNK